MLDADGHLVYDTTVEFNSKGARGPEVSYDKPEDVYRILIIGDSFVEAIQVDYAQTFYALLQDELAQHNTPARRYEVVALGRTGWGTLQEYLYYHVEGHKYNADLVILLFYINDVADNYPRFFYPGINNTNFDYVFEGDGVQIVDTNRAPLPPNAPRKLYNALPKFLRETNLARLYVRLGDPPPPVLTPGGVMTRVHPQFYIYVTDPEPEGYDEGWWRTERALTLLANDVHQDGGQLVVVPVFIGAEFIQNVSGWFPEIVAGWQWDDGLPEKRLSAILDDLPAALVPTRPVYEAYAQSIGGQVYDLIFLPEDRHFNALGHQLTKDTIYNYLVEQGIVSKEN
jgi:lysophospholipase L1-like esterase